MKFAWVSVGIALGNTLLLLHAKRHVARGMVVVAGVAAVRCDVAVAFAVAATTPSSVLSQPPITGPVSCFNSGFWL